MTEYCQCGEPVSDAFHRVFSDNDGTLHACGECAYDAATGATACPYNPTVEGFETGV